MRRMTSAKLRETGYGDEQDILRMNDEGCPNNPLFILSSKTGVEGACEILGQDTQLSRLSDCRRYRSTAAAGSSRRCAKSPNHETRRKVGFGR